MLKSPDRFVDRAKRFTRVLWQTPSKREYLRALKKSGLFDPVYYRGAYLPEGNMYRRFPEQHYIEIGEELGFRPNPDFCPRAYMRYNSDVAAIGMQPFLHYIHAGHKEQRITKDLPDVEVLTDIEQPVIRFDVSRPKAPQAIVVHMYYPDLWEEFREKLSKIEIAFDLYVTITWRGEKTVALKDTILRDFPSAWVMAVPNRGRDILPFLMLINSGAFAGYRAVAKIHTKRSPHRTDGDEWRRHLIDGIFPDRDLARKLDLFVADPDAAFWVADGQHFTGTEWWGSNLERTRQVLARAEISTDGTMLSFPAGSIYWMKPLMVSMLRSLNLHGDLFEPETAQVDGTLAHAVERVLGFLALAAGQKVLQASQIQLDAKRPAAELVPSAMRPALTSAFYLPQFHPTPENDAWWGKGYTEWRATIAAQSRFAGHLQPMLPSDLGFYDLRATEVMGEQAALARNAGIDAFCVYHYWFDGQRVLDRPLNGLLARPEIDFPFYLCWANESWRRNWDGLSGEILMNQTYSKGFERKLAADLARYMRDPRYLRPDGVRPRLMIYRPEDMPDPAESMKNLRAAFRKLKIGEVELGAVCFHVAGETPVPHDVFDFWVEMPPHGLVEGPDYMFGGPSGNVMPVGVDDRFTGLIYNYASSSARSLTEKYRAKLPVNTIAGVMPSWDNTARRGLRAHIAYGANPASFRVWLSGLLRHRVAASYRNELFINAWNEWAEKAVMEPSQTFGTAYLDVLRDEFAAAKPRKRK